MRVQVDAARALAWRRRACPGHHARAAAWRGQSKKELVRSEQAMARQKPLLLLWRGAGVQQLQSHQVQWSYGDVRGSARLTPSLLELPRALAHSPVITALLSPALAKTCTGRAGSCRSQRPSAINFEFEFRRCDYRGVAP